MNQLDRILSGEDVKDVVDEVSEETNTDAYRVVTVKFVTTAPRVLEKDLEDFATNLGHSALEFSKAKKLSKSELSDALGIGIIPDI